MASSGVAIEITGLKEFGQKLKKVDSSLPKALRLALNRSADAVIQRAAPGVPSRTGRARRSLRAKSTRTLVRVCAGDRRAPYYPWLDFGGSVGRGGSVRRPFLKDGRYLYPTYFKLRDSGEFQQILADELAAVASGAGIEVD